MINLTNYHIATFGNFKRCNMPKKSPNETLGAVVGGGYVSIHKRFGTLSSVYWYGEDKKGVYVVRGSDHWGNVGGCRWLLDGSSENHKQVVYGKCYIKDFVLTSENKKTKNNPLFNLTDSQYHYLDSLDIDFMSKDSVIIGVICDIIRLGIDIDVIENAQRRYKIRLNHNGGEYLFSDSVGIYFCLKNMVEFIKTYSNFNQVERM